MPTALERPTVITVQEERFAIKNGYSNCSKCPCRNFEGNSELCANCGHNYADHW